MNTMELLERLNAMKESVSLNAIAKPMLDTLIADVEADFRKESAAKNGSGAAQRVITKMLNNAKKYSNRESLNYAWIDEQNRQCVCDGYRGFRFRDHLPLEDRPKNCAKPIDMNALYPSDYDFARIFLPIALPTAADVKIEIAKQRAAYTGRGKCDVYYDFGADLPTVNAEYLLDLITALPDADTIWYSRINSPMYVFTDRADAIILPIRTANKFDHEHTMSAQLLHERLRDYKAKVADDPEYAMSVEEFENIVYLSEEAKKAVKVS